MLKMILEALVVFVILVVGFYMGENACVIKHQKRNEELFDRIIDKLEKITRDADDKNRKLEKIKSYANNLDGEIIKNGGSEKRV